MTAVPITLTGANITAPLTAEQEAALMGALNATLGNYTGVTYSISSIEVNLPPGGCRTQLSVLTWPVCRERRFKGKKHFVYKALHYDLF